MRGDYVKLVQQSVKEDMVVGGLADDLSLEDIAAKHEVDVERIQKEFEIGYRIEREHTNDDHLAKEIAMDHLVELPDYYSRLVDMEREAEKELVGDKAPEEKPIEEKK